MTGLGFRHHWKPVGVRGVQGGLQPLYFLIGEPDAKCGDGVGEVAGPGGADDGRGYDWALQHPGEGGAGGYPARAGGLWLCRTLVLSGFHALVVPSGFSTSVQPHRWITTW
jgi:hypothetical protein